MPLRAAASLRDRPSSTNARASMRRTCAPSVHLPASARNSALVWSAQVIFNVAPIDPPKRIACSGHRIRFLHHGEFDARVRVHAGWYETTVSTKRTTERLPRDHREIVDRIAGEVPADDLTG